MAIEFLRKSLSGSTPTIWRGECKILPAGFKPKQSFAVGTVLQRATPLYVDYSDMSAGVVKIATIVAGGSTSAPRVAKGGYFAVGDIVMKLGQNSVSKTVKAVDTSNDAYDTITLDGALTGLVAGDTIQECSAYVSAETPAAPLYTPNAIIGADKVVKENGITTIDAAFEAVVLFTNVNYPIPSDWLTTGGYCLKSNPNIMFIKQ